MSAKNINKTHPWINFEVDLRKFPSTLWMLLGEAQSKIQHIAGIALHPDDAQQLYQVALIKGVQATTAIEGNTLTEEEIQQIVETDKPLPRSKSYMEIEVKNVVDACNMCINNVILEGVSSLNEETIKQYNNLVLQNLPNLDDHIEPGRYRRVPVGVAKYKAPDPEHCDHLMKRLVSELLNQDTFKIWQERHDDYRIATAIVQAVIAHLYLAWIHPFGDGNGRTARLMEMHILYRAGVSDAAGHLLSNHYNQTRQEYYRQLQLASNARTPVHFLEYAVQGLVDGLTQHIEHIKRCQMQTMWRDYVYRKIDTKTPAAHRRAKLLVALGNEWPNGFKAKEVRYLTTQLAEAYAGKTLRTTTRDLNTLDEEQMIINIRGRWYANIPKILAFQPRKAAS